MTVGNKKKRKRKTTCAKRKTKNFDYRTEWRPQMPVVPL